MKKIQILLIVFMGFTHQLFADSPLKSIEISRAYKNIPIVIEASKAKGVLTIDLMKYLVNENNLIAVKTAIINELSLNAIGRFSDTSLDIEIDRKTNYQLFYNYSFKNEYEYNFDSFVWRADADVLLCLAYLSEIDNISFFTTQRYLRGAKKKNLTSYTTQIISALIKAQQVINKDGSMVFTLTNNVRVNKELNQDMNQEAINIIFEYMDLYKKDLESKKLQQNGMKDYEKAVDTIINQIIALKSKHKQLEGIEDLSRIEKEITAEKFWTAFHFEKGKNSTRLNGKKKGVMTSFEEDGIAIHIYFFKGDWTGAASVNPIPFGALNYVIFIKNDKNGLYQDIKDIIESEKKQLELKNSQKSTSEDYKKAIDLAEALMIKKELVLDEYNLVKLQNQFLYGKDKGMTASSVWKIIYKTKNTNGEDEYRLRGGEVFIEVDLKTQTAKIIGWSE